MTWKSIYDHFSQWIHALQYPRCIFRKRGYKDTICIPELLESVSAVTARRSEKPIEFEDFDGVKIVSSMPFEKHQVINLSMNLMGGLWKKEFVKFADKSQKCADRIPSPIYTILHPKSIKFFNEFEYPIKFDNENSFKKFFNKYPNKNDTKYIKRESSQQNAICVIRHDPTFLNYWHVVLDIDMGDGVLLDKNIGPYKTIVDAFWKILLKKALFVEEPNIKDIAIPDHFYRKNVN